MPDFPDVGDAPRITSSTFTVSFLAAGGDTPSVQFTDLDVTVAALELADARTAVGNLSNAAVVATSTGVRTEVSKTNVNPLDEAYANGSTKLVIVLQNDDLEIKTLAIPAPDESYFGGDGVTMITPNIAATAGTPARILAESLADIINVANGGTLGSGTYALLNGYRSQRTNKLKKPRIVRSSIEPEAGVFPPALPGV